MASRNRIPTTSGRSTSQYIPYQKSPSKIRSNPKKKPIKSHQIPIKSQKKILSNPNKVPMKTHKKNLSNPYKVPIKSHKKILSNPHPKKLKNRKLLQIPPSTAPWASAPQPLQRSTERNWPLKSAATAERWREKGPERGQGRWVYGSY